MCRWNVCFFAAWLSVVEIVGTAAAADESLIPVIVTGEVESTAVKQGGPIPLAVTIANGLKGPISYSAFSLKPIDWHGETVHLTLVDIHRDGKPQGLFTGRPKVEVPAVVAGMSTYPVKPGESLTVTTDARKWTIVGGWVPGKYRATVRVNGVRAGGQLDLAFNRMDQDVAPSGNRR